MGGGKPLRDPLSPPLSPPLDEGVGPALAIEAIRGSAKPGEARPWTQNKARLTGTRNCNTIVEAQQAELEIVTGLPR